MNIVKNLTIVIAVNACLLSKLEGVNPEFIGLLDKPEVQAFMRHPLFEKIISNSSQLCNILPKQYALFWAARKYSNRAILDIIAESLCSRLDGKSLADKSILHIAAFAGDSDAVCLLLSQKHSIDKRSKFQETPLICASYAGQSDMVKLLLNAGADSNAQDAERWTALHVAARWGYEDIVRELLLHKADVHARTGCGRTALHLAARAGNRLMLRELLVHGADLEAKDEKGATALHIAIYWGNLEAVRELLLSKANVHAKTFIGTTILQTAALCGNKEIIRELLLHGADINAKADVTWATLLHYISRWSRRELQKLAEQLPICYRWSEREIIRELITNKAAINIKDRDGVTPLHMAASFAPKGVVQELLERGADIEASTNEGVTALQYAAFYGHKDIATLLIGKSALLNRQAQDGSTALHIALSKNDQAMVKLLLIAGADCAIAQDRRVAPLGIVRDSQNCAMLTMMRNQQKWVAAKKRIFTALEQLDIHSVKECARLIDVTVQDIQGNTPLHAAILTYSMLQKDTASNAGEAKREKLECLKAIIKILLWLNPKAIEIRNNDDVTPVELSIAQGCFDLLNIFVQAARG